MLFGRGGASPAAADRDRSRRHDAAAVLGQRPAAPGAPPGPVNLALMTAEDLERRLAAFFGRRGYTVWPTPARGDVGACLLLCRDDQGVVVQVKRWNAPLGPEVVRATIEAIRQHAGTLRRLGCSRIGGLVVSTAPFTPEARELAGGSGVLLWDRQALEAQLRADAAMQSAGRTPPG
jgi:HJR/Mrr/RecB family endonuclease